jgi:hypothetical protein
MVDIEHKPNYEISFYKNEKKIGVLDFNGPTMTFEGDAEESAKLFFDFVSKSFASRLEQERKREWVGLTDDEISQAMFKANAIVTGETQFMFAEILEEKLKEKNHDMGILDQKKA